MRVTRPVPLLIAAVCALSLTACGGDDETAVGGSDQTTTTSPASSPTSPSEPGQSASVSTDTPPTSEASDAVTVRITERDGAITADPEIVEADRGEEIVLIVDSDAEDEFHVHSEPEPEHEFEVVVGDGQEFSLSIDNGGVWEMESHELGLPIVKFQIS